MTLSVNLLSLTLESLAVEERNQGEITRGEAGTLRSSVRRTFRVLSGLTKLHTMSEARALRGIIRGDGQVWAFQDVGAVSGLYSSTGNLSTGGGALFHDIAGGFYTVELTAGESQVFPYTPGPNTTWTILFFRCIGSFTYTHYALDSTGKKWVDGISNNAAATSWLSVTGSTATITSPALTTTQIASMVILPYTMPADWVEQIIAYHMGNASFPSLPEVVVQGNDVLGDDELVTCRGQVAQLQVENLNGALYARVPFLLEEV